MSAESVDQLLPRIEDVGQRLSKWQAEVNVHFKQHFDFNRAAKAGFEKNLVGAAQLARTEAGDGPRDEAFELLDEVLDFYWSADETVRTQLREAIMEHRSLVHHCMSECGRARQNLEKTADAAWLRRGVGAASLTDLSTDYRDWYLALGELWVIAAQSGIDPFPVFADAARLSSREKNYSGRTTCEFLSNFRVSAYFQESVAPRLKDLALPAGDKFLDKARAARQRAYAPYSGYQVGAAVKTRRGAVFTGCNVENASYGLTVCAERAAVFAAVASEGGGMRIAEIAVVNSAERPSRPCGACRQVLLEFSDEGSMLVREKAEALPIRSLLVEPFQP